MLSAYDRLDDHCYRERIGLALEDFSPGQRFRHRPGVTLSQQDNADEARETLNAASSFRPIVVPLANASTSTH